MLLEHQGQAAALGEGQDGFPTNMRKGPSQGDIEEPVSGEPQSPHPSLGQPAQGSPTPPDLATLTCGQQKGVQKL